MANPLVRKLDRFTQLSADERELLDTIARRRVHRKRQREDVVREGERPEHMHLILSGWACRYKMLEDGRRQILAFFLPGDLCDLHVYILRRMDHSIAALTPLTYAQITHDDFESATIGNPRMLQALWWDALVAASIQREWTTSIGQRSAIERVAHLLLELFHRLEMVDGTQGDCCDLPLTQGEIADALGMTPVHANRVLQELRAGKLIDLSGKRLEILDRGALTSIAMFNPNYLHLGQDGRHLDANE